MAIAGGPTANIHGLWYLQCMDMRKCGSTGPWESTPEKAIQVYQESLYDPEEYFQKWERF